MNPVDPNSIPPVFGPTSIPTDIPETRTNAPLSTTQQGISSATPTAGNTSGLLQNFILPKTTLDALGLLKPSNQGDSEVLVAQAFLTAERLVDESDSAQATALSAAAALQVSILAAFQDRLAALQDANAAAREQIASNNEALATLSDQIEESAEEIDVLQERQQDLREQINELEEIEPQTDVIAAQIASLREQLRVVTAEIGQLNDALDALEEQQGQLRAENTQLTAEIEAREDAIAAQNALVTFITATLERLIAASDGVNIAVDETQDQTTAETNDVILEDILPSMQEIFELDLEDLGLETVIDDTRIGDREIEEAIALSFGLVGSFFESLGVFFQQSSLVQLDLDSTAFGNNKSQRLQIPV
ncbi:hypothetical protein [Cognatiyoonia sp. IB215182]|uniref:hypothetical protein n=1 Tax=Cognatiyoonia sp. IB215182 TaxID=3097353 RepID=UPI002A161FB8|nr:hypothetical protein [Cognatiyoonia sp. IB215182]MDX8355146.1 hypothetical protein [Cognatiyoonia sp. IB215182]